MRFSKPFHLFVVGLFVFQTMLPINLLSATPTTKSLPEKTDSQDIPPSSLPLETVLLAELSGEMNAPLQRLHQRYPEQIALWQTLQTSLQDSDPRKPVLAQKAGTTAALISAVVGYSEHFDRAHQEIVSRIKENKDAPETEIDALLGRLYPLLQLQEKIATYELLAQTHFLDIHLLTRTINANSKQREILAEIGQFEAYRTQQIKQFLTVREEFENVRKGCAFLNRATEDTQLGPLKQNIADYRELATLFAARRHQNSSKSERDLFARLGLIAADKNRELQAVLSVLSEGREGVSWPVLFHLGPDRDQTHPAGQVFSPYRVLSVLRDMRTSFTELADILKQRNQLLVDSEFLHGDDMLWLTVQIELENLRLTRLAEVIDLTGKQVPQEDTDAYQQNMIHWEEFGLLKEDILSVEAVILNELSAYRDSEALVGDESWRQVLSLLQRQNRWRLSWSAIAASFEQVVDDFKTFQARMIEEELDAIETLRSDIKGIQARSSEMESPIAHFFTLVDQVLAEQYEATRVNRDLKTQVHQQDEVDPLFSHFFGIRSERFWHDFKHMGIALWDHEYLTGNLARIRAHLLALNNAGQDGNRQALVVLQLAQQIGLIDRIDYDGTSWTVFLRSATDSMLLTGGGGKAPPELRSAAFDRQMPRHATVRLLLQSLFCVVPSAHAGAYEQFTGWSGNVFNQMKKNWVNYAVTGVVMVGALAAAPVVAAAGATAATVTAVTAVATTTALGAKAAFYAQASADLAIGTSRQAVNQMDFTGNEYATKKNFNTAIDAMETTYNIAKVAEGVKNLVNPGQSIEEVAEQVNKASQATHIEQLSYLERLKELQQTADKVRRQIKAAEEAGDAFDDWRKISDLFRDRRHLVALERLIKNVGDKVAQIGQKGAQAIEKIKRANPTELVSNVSRLGQRIAQGSDLPSSLLDSAEGVTHLTKDSDGDGTPDAQDLCPGDPLKTAPGVCGCGKSDQDGDGDGTADCKQSVSENTTEPGQATPTDLPPEEKPPDDTPPGAEPPDEETPGDPVPDETPPDEEPATGEQDAPGDVPPQVGNGEEGADEEPPPEGTTPPADVTGDDATGGSDGEAPTPIDTLRDAERQSTDPSAAITGTPLAPFPDNTTGSSPGSPWMPSAIQVTEAERGNAAGTGNALSQLNADRQRMETAYQTGQTENQRQSAESIAQIDRQRSTQMVDAVVGGLTSGVAQGVGTLGERIGHGAGTRIAQDTGLVDRHPKPPTPGGAGQCHSNSDCPAGSACDSASATCVKQDTAAKAYRGSWGGSATCTANYGSRGTGTCPWKGSIQLTLDLNGGVSGTITGGGMFNFNDDGHFTSCGGYNESSTVSGAYANGSFAARSSGGARITGSYTDTSITGTTTKSGTNAISEGRTMNCTAAGSISLSR